MAALEFILFWMPVLFGLLVAASYIGTKLALRSYFDDEEFSPTNFISNGDDDQDP